VLLRLAVTAVWISAFSAGAAGPRPAIEVFLLAGGYAHGNLLLSPQALSTGSQWRPQAGGGALLPLGSKWGVLFDATTSAIETHWKWDGAPGAGPGDNFTRVRRVVLVPSVVRLWRRSRFTVYAGGGPGFEHDREATRFRAIVGRGQNGEALLAPEFTDHRFHKTGTSLALQAGVIVRLTGRWAVRSGYSYLRRYADERPSQGVAGAIGYRF
jgi:opacity protein-like surface antigen